jgi:phosphorylcholine metabolism protein LicD
MGGQKETSEKLNKTLLFLITLLNNNNIKNWFVCYGTLLGLVRENSCIDNDDDIDIIIDKSNYDIIKKILKDNNFIISYQYGIKDSNDIIKTESTSEYSSIDIYMGDYNNGYVKDLWNKLIINDCFLDTEWSNETLKTNKTFIEKKWNGQNIYYPNNYKRILLNRYGKDWKIKQNKKIAQTMTEL